MIEYILKLVQDKPLIRYIEDPLIGSQSEEWLKLKEKLDEKKVRLGSRKLYESQSLLDEHPSD